MKLHDLILIAFTYLLISCGAKTNSPFVVATSSPLLPGFNETGCQSPEQSDLYKSSLELSKKLEIFSHFYNTNRPLNSEEIQLFKSKSSKLFLKSSPLDPLIMGEAKLNKEFSSLVVRFENIVGKNTYEKLGVVEASELPGLVLSKENTLSIDQIFTEVQELKIKSLRWQSLQCSLKELSQRKSKDLRGYFAYLKEKNNPDGVRKRQNSAAIKLCEDFHSPALCISEQSILKRQNRESNFNEHYEKMGLAKSKVFFDRYSVQRFSCHKDQNTIVLEIPYVGDQTLAAKLGGGFLRLERAVANRWSNDQLKVILKRVEKKEEGVIDFVWKGGAISYVERSNPFTINLSEFLYGETLTLTVSHELGHVLGFPDCYHEFYDRKAQEVIYYSLDKEGDNLMCTMSSEAIVPDLYFNQLIESACRF